MVVSPSDETVEVAGGTGPGQIGSLHVEFVIPDGGAFGRDKRVAYSDATAAKVSYVLDGRRVTDTVGVSQAVDLVNRAGAAEAVAERDSGVLRSAQAQRAEQVRATLAALHCPVCSGPYLVAERVTLQAVGFSGPLHLQLLVCRECGHALTFVEGRGAYGL